MAIISHAFGRVTLTGADAKKFQDQVTYGRPKAAAVEAVKRGVKMSRDFKESGGVLKVTLSRER
jgi:hypothetical protein